MNGTQATTQVAGKLLFTVGLIADTHVQDPNDTRMPFKANKDAYRRTQLAFDQVKEHDPAFIFHLGDVTHPVPFLDTFDAACDMAKTIIASTGLQTYIVPGNHDAGDKIGSTYLNHGINNYAMRKYKQHWGDQWYSMDQGGCHFVVINSSLIASGLIEEEEQWAWLEHDLAENSGKRMFMFTHYPLFMEKPDEITLFDNFEYSCRQRILGMLSKYKVEALMAGHVHNYFYNQYENTELYGLLSTSFVRSDYTEMFSVAAGDEFGRNDLPKLGWSLLKVYEKGHVIETFRSLDNDAAIANSLPVGLSADFGLHPKHSDSVSSLGVNLRSAWAEAKPLMYYGPIEEFERRYIRNDYLPMALWETGIRYLRVPAKDLLEEDYVTQMRNLALIGQRFIVFTVGVPDDATRKMLKMNRNAYHSLEVIMPWREVDKWNSELTNFVNAISPWRGDMTIYLTSIYCGLDHRSYNKHGHGYHLGYGFYADETELDMLQEFHDSHGKALDLSYTFRIDPTMPLLETGRKVCQWAEASKISVSFNIAYTRSTPAEPAGDDVASASRIAEATLLAALHPNAPVILETLVDVDRGYSPTTGLYDFLYNPKLPGRVARGLNVLMKGKEVGIIGCSTSYPDTDLNDVDGISQWRMEVDGQSWTVLLPRAKRALGTLTSAMKSLLQDSVSGPSLSLVSLARHETIHSVEDIEVAEPILVVNMPRTP